MTDNEIKKALECCLIADSKCADCHFSFERHFCKNALLKQTLDLINRLEAEVDDLKRDDLPRCKDALRRVNEKGVALVKENQELKAEIERQREYIELLDIEREAIRNCAVKEFAERLCEDRVSNDPVVIATKCLLKEMAGEA